MNGNQWTPILDGDLRARALQTVSDITLDVDRSEHRSRDSSARQSISLMEGSLGLAVLHHYWGTYAGDRTSIHNAARAISEAIGDLASTQPDPSLYGGVSGLGWAVSHLGVQTPAGDCDFLTSAIDRAVGRYLDQQTPTSVPYDLISGLVGFGVYTAERDGSSARSLQDDVLSMLYAAHQNSGSDIAWLSRRPWATQQSIDAPYYDLGIAHGVPGVIAYLGATLHRSTDRMLQSRLLDGAVPWLLQQRIRDSATGSTAFPSFSGSALARRPARCAWCYGDLGVAAALLQAAFATRSENWKAAAVEIAKDAAHRLAGGRTPTARGLCHGIAGIGHTFNRLYQCTGDQELLAAASAWITKTLDSTTSNTSAHLDTSLLQGTAGVALALLAAATEVEPEWDRLLLLPALPSEEHSGV